MLRFTNLKELVHFINNLPLPLLFDRILQDFDPEKNF